MTALTEDRWFSSFPIGDGVVVIAEPGYVTSYLLLGRDLSVLFDSGLGIFDISAEVTRFTNTPVLLVNSHEHLDHCGGNRFFAEVAGHPLLAARGPRQADHETAVRWLGEYSREITEAYAAYRALDEEHFHQLDARMHLKAPPSESELAHWHHSPVVPTRGLADGELIDLGDRLVEVIHCPGHTPASLALHDTSSGSLLTGDAVIAGVSYAHLPGADPAEFARSAQLLLDRTSGDLRRVLVPHTLRFSMPPDFLDEVTRGWQRLHSDEAPAWRPWSDMFGIACQRADFDRFSITRPGTLPDRKDPSSDVRPTEA